MNWLKVALKPLAMLPLPVLYALSDAACFVLYRVAGYRRGVVRDNLQKCFPDKSEGELRSIEKKFYRNFTDNVVETLKLMHISDAEMSRRMTFSGVEHIDRLLAEGRSVVVYFSHTFCWEWAPSVTLHAAHSPSDKVVYAQVYRPLRNKPFDRLMLEVRSRFGSRCLPKASTLRDLLKLRREGVSTVTGFMSDQHPSHGDPGHLTTLLGQPTLMISGTETLARKMAMGVVYWDIEKTSRGHYHITTRLLSDDASQSAPGEITENYTRLLELAIRRDPPLWLWSHKRWKHPVNIEK